MNRIAIDRVECWIFDLDNTLYPPHYRLFDQIEAKIVAYVMHELSVTRDEADVIRRRYWRDYGTTLSGLMRVHGMDPAQYLFDVHDIDLSALPAAPELRDAIGQLGGRKIVYTNGSRQHACNVLAARGLQNVIDAIYGIEDGAYHPKPDRRAFELILESAKVEPCVSVMFEDDPRNLEVPHDLGMTTVLVGPAIDAGHIHYQTEDLTGFLRALC